MFQPWSHPLPHFDLTLRGWFTPPRGKPVIHFLHGNGFCGRTYEPMLKLLAEDFDLWLSDTQGHGDSDPGRAFHGWNRNAHMALEAFKAHRQQFGEVPIFAAGHSFGAVLTTLMLAEPGQPFQKAVLLDPVFFPPAMGALLVFAQMAGFAKYAPLARASIRRRRTWPNREEAFRALYGRGTYRGWDDTALRAFVDHALRDCPDGSVELKCDPAQEARIFSSGPRGLWRAVRRVPIPTLIAFGKQTFPFVRQSVPRAVKLNPHLQASMLDGGHCFMQEHPAVAAKAIRDFLTA